jgi:hypothetical protein
MKHSVLQRLWKLAEREAQNWNTPAAFVFDPIGLLLQWPLKYGGYQTSPANSRMFAETGGDGVHFSFLATDDRIDEHTPIVMTVPCNLGIPNVVVGENLLDFLHLGSRFGFFDLEELTYQPDKVIAAYLDENWRGSERCQFGKGLVYDVDERKRALMRSMQAEFNLTPWKDISGRLAHLQSRYSSFIGWKLEG